MFALSIVLLSLFSAVLTDKCDNVTCPKVPKHYEEIGCKPIIPAGQCCAQNYDCTEFHGRDKSKCYHKEKVYEPNQEIEDPELTSSCTVACRCNRFDPEEPAKIVCAHIDCPEFFGSVEPPKGKNCIAQYRPNGCCKDRDVCDDELKDLATCQFNGKTYYEGQKIDTDQCYSCHCSKGFEDKPVEQNKHCSRIDCNIDLRYSDRLHDGCVPIYYKNEDCCPIGTRCPDNQTTVVKAKNSNKSDGGPQCTFGKLKLAVGDTLSLEDESNCKLCTCQLPPFVTCVQTC